MQIDLDRVDGTERVLHLVMKPGEEVLSNKGLTAKSTQLFEQCEGLVDILRTDHQIKIRHRPGVGPVV